MRPIRMKMDQDKHAVFGDLFLKSDPESLERLRARCAETPQPDEDRIVAYLAAPLEFEAVGIIPPDQINGGDLPCSWALRSDGIWIWSNALEYYVRRHHFRVPRDFVRHMAARDWQPPQPEDVDRADRRRNP
jgi:hypothetical protein